MGKNNFSSRWLKETIILLETNVDHLTGEELGAALTLLNSAPQTLDVTYIPAIGKKNRPCGILQALCRPDHADFVCAMIFRHLHTLGIRKMEIERLTLPRETAKAFLNDGCKTIAKYYELEGQIFCRPEADDLLRVASTSHAGLPAMRIAKIRIAPVNSGSVDEKISPRKKRMPGRPAFQRGRRNFPWSIGVKKTDF